MTEPANLLPADRALYTVGEALAALRISKATFYRLVSAKRLRLVKLGRATVVRRDDLEALIEHGGADTKTPPEPVSSGGALGRRR